MSLIIFVDELDFLSNLVTCHPGRNCHLYTDYTLKILSKSQGISIIIARSFKWSKKFISFQGGLSNLRVKRVVPGSPGEQ